MADIPRRKPIPSPYTYNNPQQPPQPLHQQATLYTHSRSRTTSSNTFPTAPYPSQHPPQHQSHIQPPQSQYPQSMQVHAYTSRRTPSQGTFSTTGSAGNGNGPLPFRQSSHSQDLRRSTSSRSGSSIQPTSYVALMRKQKATVWCDRAQHEDPRIVAAQKAAKLRATLEVTGGGAPSRVSTSGSAGLASGNRVTAKIRHHGKSGLVGYSPGDLVGGVGGVPMRLSASEVEGGDNDDDGDSSHGPQYGHHRRTGSGRSSIGSARKGLTYSRQSGASSTGGRWSSGNTPPGERQDSMENVDEAGETPVPGPAGTYVKGKDYFTAGDGHGDGTQSAGSGSSGERADGLADLGANNAARLASNSLLQSAITREKSVRNPEELRRRGSVDERTMTMSAGRLYIANPDADDSD